MKSKKTTYFTGFCINQEGNSNISIFPDTKDFDIKKVHLYAYHGDRPDVFLEIGARGEGWFFLIDTSVRYNLLDPVFFKEWVDFSPYPKINDDDNECYPIPHEKLKGEKIICKDGIKRICKRVKLKFILRDNHAKTCEYEEIFHIDSALCQFYNGIHIKELDDTEYFIKSYIGVLGSDFLRKYQWIIDYSEMKS